MTDVICTWIDPDSYSYLSFEWTDHSVNWMHKDPAGNCWLKLKLYKTPTCNSYNSNHFKNKDNRNILTPIHPYEFKRNILNIFLCVIDKCLFYSSTNFKSVPSKFFSIHSSILRLTSGLKWVISPQSAISPAQDK